ncbi:hypothetical protein [Streptomyces sp. NPDC057690]
MCNPTDESEDPDDSREGRHWTSYQKWSLGMAASGVVITIAIGAAQFLAR